MKGILIPGGCGAAARWLLGLAVAWTVALGARPVHAADGGAAGEMKVQAKTPVVFSTGADTTTLLLPVQLPDSVEPGKVSIELAQVQQDRRIDAQLSQRFTVDPKLVLDQGPTPKIRLQLQGITQMAPGEYQLVLMPRFNQQPAPPLLLALERPAVELVQPGKQTLDLRAPWGVGEAASAAPRTLRINPANPASAPVIGNVTVYEGPFVNAQGEALNATLGLTSAVSLMATQPLVLDLKPDGFPVGTAQGKLVVQGLALKAPLTVDLEVRVRRSALWIIVMVALGIALGWWLRVRLQQQVDVSGARSAGLAAMRQLQLQIRNIADAPFKAAIAPDLRALDEALGGKDRAAMERTSAAAAATVQKALQALQTRLEAAAATRKALSAVSAGREGLPQPMQRVLAPLADALQLADKQLAAQDADGAQKALDAAQDTMLRNLALAAASVQAALPGLNVPLQQVPGLLDPRKNDSRPVAEQAKVLAALPQEIDTADPADLRNGLDRWRRYGVQRQQIARDWAGWLREDMAVLNGLIRERLVPAQNPLNTQLAALQAQYSACAAALETLASTDPFAAVSLPVEEARAALEAVVQALVQQHGTVDSDTARESVRQANEALQQRHFFEALRALSPPPQQRLGNGPQALPTSTPRGEAAVAQAPATTVPATAPVQEPALVLPVIDPEVLRAMSLTEASRQQTAQTRQTVIVAAVLLAVSYTLYRDQFIGTPMELLGLFFFGFTADLSVSKLAEQAGALGIKPKP